jgi:ABC-2 type transport system permease protein
MKKGLAKNISNKAYYSIVVAIALVVIVLLNVIVSFLDFRVDFTADKRYSLTSSTVDFLSNEENFSERILFKIYLDGDLPAEVKRLRTAVRDKLNEFKYYAGKQIEFEFIDPEATLNQADKNTLKELLYDKGRGIRPAQIYYKVKGKSQLLEIFPGATVEYRVEILLITFVF